jgi:YfiH family protein
MHYIQTIDEYITSFPAEVQTKLREIRELLTHITPLATETIKYGIPTLLIDGKNYLHYGGAAHHVALYPTAEPIATLRAELSAYTTSKGAIQFPLSAPLPLTLIRRIALHRLMTGFLGYPLISQVHDGNMKLGTPGAATRRASYYESLGIDPTQVAAAELAHGCTVAMVEASQRGQTIPQTDGLITTDPTTWLSITVADCLPVVLYQPGRVVALLHCGWRGLAGGIIPQAIAMMAEKLSLPAKELSVWIGPGIEAKDYEVGAEFAARFAQYPRAIERQGEKTYLDLRMIAMAQLTQAGVKKSATHSIDVCTYCTPTLFSARRDQTDPVQALMVLAHL